jgi:glutamate-ammonia-ligase adenylyltransferase
VAGAEALRERFVSAVSDVRYPVTVTEAALKQMRTLKARMEAERLPRGTDPRRHLKLGPGGLSDVEWTVQLVQLRHAHQHEGLRTTETLQAIGAARSAGVLTVSDARALADAWRLATDLRGAIALRGRPGDADTLPGDYRDLGVLASIMGLSESGQSLDERYARLARRARAVTERVFFGWEASS